MPRSNGTHSATTNAVRVPTATPTRRSSTSVGNRPSSATGTINTFAGVISIATLTTAASTATSARLTSCTRTSRPSGELRARSENRPASSAANKNIAMYVDVLEGAIAVSSATLNSSSRVARSPRAITTPPPPPIRPASGVSMPANGGTRTVSGATSPATTWAPPSAAIQRSAVRIGRITIANPIAIVADAAHPTCGLRAITG